MEEQSKDNAGVRIPPPLIYLGALIAGAAANYFFPLPFLPNFAAQIAGVLLIASAILIFAAAFQLFKRAKTNLEPWKPTTAIVSDGIYGFSRNPIYLAFTLFYAGIALLFNSLWTLALLVPVLLVIHYGVILREEAYLERKFGIEYLNYKERVRRWL